MGVALLLTVLAVMLAQPLAGRTWHGPDTHSSLPHMSSGATLSVGGITTWEDAPAQQPDAIALRTFQEPGLLRGRPEAEPLGHPPR